MILIAAGVLTVLLLFAGVRYIVSPRHVDGATAAASDPPIAAGPAAAAAAAKAPGPEAAAEPANRKKPAAPADPNAYVPPKLPPALAQDFIRKGFTLDVQSGNYLGGRTYAKTLHEPLVPILINGRYAKDLRGHTVYLRQTIHDTLLTADTAMFKAKGQHLQVNYGFRSNELQAELFQQISGHGKVAQPGMSFHETGMAIDLQNWREAQRYMIEAGFVGGCYGIEEDLVHYSIDEVTKSSNVEAFKRCTLKEIPKDILKGAGKVGGAITGIFHRKNQ